MSEKNVRLGKRKLICGIKNCRVRESRYISKSGDFQKTPNICDDCLEKAYGIMTAAESTPGGVAFGKVYSSTGSGKVVRMKKKKLLCAVKGCPSRESWYISAGGDFYGSPNICSDCLKKAYAECFQAADLSGFDIVCTPFESGGTSFTGHPARGSAAGEWILTNQAYYMSCSLFKAGDVVSLEITGTDLGGDDRVTVNGANIGISTVAGYDIPKTVLTSAIELFITLGKNATVKVRYYDPAPVAAEASQALEAAPAAEAEATPVAEASSAAEAAVAASPAKAAPKRKVTTKSAEDGEKA